MMNPILEIWIQKIKRISRREQRHSQEQTQEEQYQGMMKHTSRGLCSSMQDSRF